MQKAILLFLLIAIFQVYSQEYRLIQFNETYSVWMTTEEVEEMMAECAAKVNGPSPVGFMDITENPVANPNTVVYAFPAKPTHQTTVNPLLSTLSEGNVKATVERMQAFNNRYYTSSTGVTSAEWLLSEYKRLAGSRTDITVTTVTNTRFPQPSIIVSIRGNGAKANQRVIIGGHLDSTAGSASARSPGADDDASGSATVLEVFRALVQGNFKPERTIEFHAYAAEEAGLLGSQQIANDYKAKGIVVYAMLQNDMTGYVKPGTTPTIGVVTDFVAPDLTAFARELRAAYTPSTTGTNTQCGYGCSDHASWTRAGYPAAFLFESTFANSNPKIHTANDLSSELNYAHALQFVKLSLAFLVELSLAP